MNDRHAQSIRDESIVCADCQRSFLWSAGEQKFYLSKGLSAPRRCPECRRTRRLTINPDPNALDEALRHAREEFRKW